VYQHHQDFVVFKLDIDYWKIEESIVHQILENPEIHSRIDEMYWEHHVNFLPMSTAWGAAAIHKEFKQADSIALFTQLRQKGIKVHSWV
jgi:hypothetical protein